MALERPLAQQALARLLALALRPELARLLELELSELGLREPASEPLAQCQSVQAPPKLVCHHWSFLELGLLVPDRN